MGTEPGSGSGEISSLSLVIPCFNAGAEFEQILPAMLGQELEVPLEVLIIDSGSTDGTLELARSLPVNVIEIPPTEFDHGLTRSLGIRETNGEVIAFVTQDARPANREWLAWLLACFEDPEVAGAYGSQTPRPEATIFVRERLRHWAAAGSQQAVQWVEQAVDFEALPPLEKLKTVAFDNVNSAVRRKDALARPFRQRSFGEDLDWAHRSILAGRKIVFEPRSRVVHSHNRSIWYEFKRVFLDHENLCGLLGLQTVPTPTRVLTSSVAAVRHHWNLIDEEPLSAVERLALKARSVPYGFSQNLAQYLGAGTALHGGGSGASWRGLLYRWLRRDV